MLTSDKKTMQLWKKLFSHNNAQPWLTQHAQPHCQQEQKSCWSHEGRWATLPPEFILKCVFIHICGVYFSFSGSAILGLDSIQGNTSIISGSGPQIVLWLRLWKLLLSKLLADLPVLFWAGLKRAWWDIESLMNHDSGRNSRSFTVRFWLLAFKSFLSKQPSCSLSVSCYTQIPPSLKVKVWQKREVVWSKIFLGLVCSW